MFLIEIIWVSAKVEFIEFNTHLLGECTELHNRQVEVKPNQCLPIQYKTGIIITSYFMYDNIGDVCN